VLISIVLPVHNQADHIGAVLDSYLRAVRPLPVQTEFVVVANACSDDTATICRQRGVRVLELDDGGWGRAVRHGLAHAEGDIVGYTNSARTTPEMLALVLVYASAYPEVVLKANRRIRDNWRRRLGSVLYNLQCRQLFDLSVWDVNGTPKLFPREFSGLMELTRDDDLVDLEFVVACRDRSYPIVEVPILATVRHGGRSTTNYGAAWRMYYGAWSMCRARS
jgi:glycosyltransferase involved in cell wall biosynthesis